MSDRLDWMRGCSPLKGAALSLLVQRPGHGYDLANRLNRRLGPAWQVDAKDLYRPLRGLEREGLVWSERVVCDTPSGSRHVYHPTEKAEQALAAWMGARTPIAPMRAELHTKLSVAREQDMESLLETMEAYERDRGEIFAATSRDLPPIDTLVGLEMRLVRTAALGYMRAELEWIAEARRLLTEFAPTPTGR
jgi:DNA-binding PadR family transcriptional regulator